MYSLSLVTISITFTIWFAGKSLAAPLDNREGNSINSIAGIDDSKLTFKANVDSPLWEDFSIRGDNPAPVNYSGYKLLRAEPTVVQTPLIDSLGDNKNGVEVWNWRQVKDDDRVILDVLTPPHQLDTVTNLFDEIKLKYTTVIEDLQMYIDSEKHVVEVDCEPFCGPESKGGSHSMDWDRYHDIADMDGYMTYLNANHADRVKIIEIGQSWQNRTLRVMRISSGEFDPSKPAIWVEGGMHGREWVAPATAMYLMNQLVEWDPEGNATKFFNWYILPVANPDGYEYSRHHDRLWRKTRSIHPATESSGCVGVDANRNFGYQWNQDGSSNSPCSEEYAGPSSFSEPETKAIRDFLQEKKNEIKMYLALHAYSQMVVFPSSTDKNGPNKNYRELDELATVITDTINKQPSSSIYTHGSANDLLFRSYGSSDDYAMGELKVPYAFSLELRDLGKYGFILPPGQIESTAKETYTGVVAMVDRLHEKLNAPAAI